MSVMSMMQTVRLASVSKTDFHNAFGKPGLPTRIVASMPSGFNLHGCQKTTFWIRCRGSDLK
jgi:hypothetical protein